MDMELVIIFAIFFGILNGVVASNKNRDVAGWVVLGALFGLLSFIILLFCPKLEK